MKKQMLFFLLFPIIGFCQSIHYQYDCNFENSCSIIQLDTSSSNIWQIGIPNKMLFDSSYSSNKALVTDTSNYYPMNNHSTFEIHLAEAPHLVEVYFKYKLDTDTLRDGFNIDLLYDTTIGWISASDSFPGPMGNAPLVNSFVNLYSLEDTLYNGVNGMSGNSNGWQEAMIGLVWHYPIKQNSEIIDTLIFRFNFISDSIETNHEGMLIDDIRVVAPILGAINNIENNHFNVFPNPASSSITLDLEKEYISQSTMILLYDNFGKILLYEPILENEISIEQLPKGIYNIVLMDKKEILGKSKVIKK